MKNTNTTKKIRTENFQNLAQSFREYLYTGTAKKTKNNQIIKLGELELTEYELLHNMLVLGNQKDVGASVIVPLLRQICHVYNDQKLEKWGGMVASENPKIVEALVYLLYSVGRNPLEDLIFLQPCLYPLIQMQDPDTGRFWVLSGCGSHSEIGLFTESYFLPDGSKISADWFSSPERLQDYEPGLRKLTMQVVRPLRYVGWREDGDKLIPAASICSSPIRVSPPRTLRYISTEYLPNRVTIQPADWKKTTYGESGLAWRVDSRLIAFEEAIECGKIFVLSGGNPMEARAAKQDFQAACSERLRYANSNKTRRLLLLLDPLQEYVSKSNLEGNYLTPLWDPNCLSTSGMNRVINCWVTRSEEHVRTVVAQGTIFFQSFGTFMWLKTDDIATNLRAGQIVKEKNASWAEPSELSGLETMGYCKGRHSSDDKLVKYPGQIDEVFVAGSEEEKQLIPALRRFYQALIEKHLHYYPNNIMEKHYMEGACVTIPSV